MKQLKQLSHSRLTTTQLQFFSLQAMGLIQPFLETSSFLSRQHTELKGSTDAIKKLTGVSYKLDITEELTAADEDQDQILIAIRETCKAKVASAFFNKNAADEGGKVLDVMDDFGKDLIYGSYEKQCATIPAFITRMAEPKNAESAQKVGIAPFVTALAPAHAKFKDLYNQKLTETEVPTTTIKVETKKLRYRLDALLPYIDAQITDSVDEFAALKAPMNQLITEVMSQVRARKTRSETTAQ